MYIGIIYIDMDTEEIKGTEFPISNNIETTKQIWLKTNACSLLRSFEKVHVEKLTKGTPLGGLPPK